MYLLLLLLLLLLDGLGLAFAYGLALGLELTEGQQGLPLPIAGWQDDRIVEELVDGREQLAALVGLVRDHVEGGVRHQRRDGPTDLVVVQVRVARTQEREHKAHGNGDFRYRRHQDTCEFDEFLKFL